MAVRMNCSLQTTLSFLNPSLLSLRFKPSHFNPQKPHFHFSRRKKALFCTYATTDSTPTPSNDEPFILTTPLYYVNAPPHMGSAYSTIAADAIARFQRLLGKKVIFITGTDEHGEKIATAAMDKGSTPADHCNLISELYKTLWKDLDISYDKFIRTTDNKHEAIVKEFYSRVFANGDIYRADYEGLYCVNCEEYKDGMKMGKSLGNTLEPNDLVNKFGTDAVRYFFLREVEFGNDGDYSEERFINIVNAHLANTIGNLLNRTLGLLKKNCQSTLVVDSTTAAEGNAFKDNVERLVDKAHIHYGNLSLSSACEAVLEIGNVCNSYMDERAPWSLFKQGGTASELAAKDLVIILETVRIIAIALSPVTPNLSSRIYEQLGYSRDQFDAATWRDTKWGGLKGGQVMAQPKPIFARIENQTEVEDKGVAVGKTVKKVRPS